MSYTKISIQWNVFHCGVFNYNNFVNPFLDSPNVLLLTPRGHVPLPNVIFVFMSHVFSSTFPFNHLSSTFDHTASLLLYNIVILPKLLIYFFAGIIVYLL